MGDEPHGAEGTRSSADEITKYVEGARGEGKGILWTRTQGLREGLDTKVTQKSLHKLRGPRDVHLHALRIVSTSFENMGMKQKK